MTDKPRLISPFQAAIRQKTEILPNTDYADPTSELKLEVPRGILRMVSQDKSKNSVNFESSQASIPSM